MNLFLSVYGELFVIHLEKVMYMQADDHYTHVYYSSECHFMVPFGLSQMEKAIVQLPDQRGAHMVRVGRKYIINMDMIYHINVLRRSINLSNWDGNSVVLEVSQAALKDLVALIQSSHPVVVKEGTAGEVAVAVPVTESYMQS